jgi:hypothetical protein
MTRIVLLFGLTLSPAAARADAPPELAAVLKRAAEFRPNGSDFAWREIPWHDDPTAALKEARAEKRPLLVWLAGGRDRDGTPLERC